MMKERFMWMATLKAALTQIEEKQYEALFIFRNLSLILLILIFLNNNTFACKPFHMTLNSFH